MSIDHTSSRRARWIAYAGAVAATALAVAGAHAQVTQPGDPGVMSFPNVRVISMPPTAESVSPGAASSPGLRAFIDPATGTLTENPTPAHLRDLEVIEAAGRAGASRPGGASIVTVRNGTRATLDASSMLHSVARRAGDGDLDVACVVGDSQLEAFLEGRGTTPPHAHAKPVAKRVAQ